MQNILVVDHDPVVLNILSPYFVNSIKSYHKHYNVTYLGMILHKDNNYFTIGLKESYKGYTEYTPIILFKRDPTLRSFLYEDDHLVPYSNKKETYPKNLVVEYDLIKNKCKDENTYLNHLQELARDHSWNNLLDSKKFAYNNEKDNYPYPTILNVF